MCSLNFSSYVESLGTLSDGLHQFLPELLLVFVLREIDLIKAGVRNGQTVAVVGLLDFHWKVLKAAVGHFE